MPFFDPRFNAVAMGYVVFTWDGAYKAFGPEGWFIPILDDVSKSVNLKLLGAWPNGWESIGAKSKFINTLEAAKGVKMRVAEIPLVQARYKALGFQTVVVSYAELPAALQSGMIDARSTGTWFEHWAMRDSIKYVTEHFENFETHEIFANVGFWNSLHPDDQEIILSLWGEAIRKGWDIVKSEEEKYKNDCIAQGTKVYTMNAAELKPFVQIVREKEWAVADEIMGKVFVDKIRANAEKVPQ